MVEDPPAQEATPFIADGTFTVKTFTAPGMPSHMMMNTEKAPTDDLAVRQAMIQAVNQEELAQTAFRRTPVCRAQRAVADHLWLQRSSG